MMPIDAPAHPVGGTSLSARIRRHSGQIVRLAVPIMVANTAIIAMDVVDTIMVGRYATIDLAYIGIAGAVVAPLLVCGIGFLQGTQVAVANAFGAEDLKECGGALRRSVPYALAVGLISAFICLFGVGILRLLAQDSQIVAGGGRVILILGLSLPALMVGITCQNFFDGLGRPLIGMSVLIFANIVNVFGNWVLIYGNLGAPAMGAEGAAWATLIGRLLFPPIMLACLIFLVDRPTYGLENLGRGFLTFFSGRSWTAFWADSAFQRRLGNAFAVGLLVEAFSFEVLHIYAGWLGPGQIAAYSIAFRVLGIMFMVSLGIAMATGVRVGIANGRRDLRDVAIAGGVGMSINLVVSTLIALVVAFNANRIASLFSADLSLIPMIVPAIILSAMLIPFDTGQAVAVRALRGRGDAWIPTAVQIFSYLIIMLPLTWFLALPMGRGLPGLFEGALIASIISVFLQTGRFGWLCWADAAVARLSGARQVS